MTRKALATLLLLTAACGSNKTSTSASATPTPSEAPLALTITAPARGSTDATATSLQVKGTATSGAGITTLTVNGTTVTPGANGDFSATVPATAGINILHTVATDASGKQAMDTRAVMTGTMADPSAKVSNGIAARINSDTMSALADIGADYVAQTDIGAEVQPLNPVVNAGGSCLGAQVSVNSVTDSGVAMTLTPVAGGIAFSATITDLDVEMTTHFDVICIGGSAGTSIKADSFTVSGLLDLSVSGGAVKVALPTAASSFKNFQLSFGIIPSEIIDLIPDLGSDVAGVLTSQLQSDVPSMLESALSNYAFNTSVALLGNDINVSVVPTTIAFDTSGGTLLMDTTFTLGSSTGATIAGYPTIAAPIPSLPEDTLPGDGFHLAVNDNAINQLLNEMWAGGVLNQTVDVSSLGGAAAALGAIADTIKISAPLPPLVSTALTGDAVTATVGDLDVTLYKSGAMVGEIAVSAEIGVEPAVNASNDITLTLATPEVYFDLIQDGTGTGALSNSTVQSFAGIVAASAGSIVNGMIGTIPVPSLQGATVSNLASMPAATGGYLELGGDLTAN